MYMWALFDTCTDYIKQPNVVLEYIWLCEGVILICKYSIQNVWQEWVACQIASKKSLNNYFSVTAVQTRWLWTNTV